MSINNFPGACCTKNMLLITQYVGDTVGDTCNLRDMDIEGNVMITQIIGTMSGTLNGKIEQSADGVNWSDISGAVFQTVTATNNIQRLYFNSNYTLGLIRYTATIDGIAFLGVVAHGIPKSV